MRNRYLRRSTFMTGHARPFTRITSPKAPEWSSSSKSSWPLVSNMVSLMTSGTS